MSNWIDVNERKPAETPSIFSRFIDPSKWSNDMWKEDSDKVLVTIRFKDGTKITGTGETHDGVWHTNISRTLEHVVTHWMPFPEPAK